MSDKPTNNPPAAILELDAETAAFLCRNCSVNIEFGLKALMLVRDRETAEKLIAQNDQFKKIRDVLKAQGISDEDPE